MSVYGIDNAIFTYFRVNLKIRQIRYFRTDELFYQIVHKWLSVYTI